MGEKGGQGTEGEMYHPGNLAISSCRCYTKWGIALELVFTCYLTPVVSEMYALYYRDIRLISKSPILGYSI